MFHLRYGVQFSPHLQRVGEVHFAEGDVDLPDWVVPAEFVIV